MSSTSFVQRNAVRSQSKSLLQAHFSFELLEFHQLFKRQGGGDIAVDEARDSTRSNAGGASVSGMRILIYTRNLSEKTRRIGGIVLREREPFRGLHVNTSALARPRKVGVIGLTGEFGVKMGAACDLCRCVPTKSTPRMQEIHTYDRAHDLRDFGADVYERVKEGIQNLRR